MRLKNKYHHMLHCRFFRLFLNNPHLHNKYFAQDSDCKSIKISKNQFFNVIPNFETNLKPGYEDFDLIRHCNFKNQQEKDIIMEHIHEIIKPRNVKEVLIDLIKTKINNDEVVKPIDWEKKTEHFNEYILSDVNLRLETEKEIKRLESAKILKTCYDINHQAIDILKKLISEKENIEAKVT